MPKIAFEKKQIFGDWELISRHAFGGNSSVWIAKNVKNGEESVIKLLRKTHDTAKLRFKDEIAIISANQDEVGVMKLLDFSDDSEFLWYVMPKSVTLKDYLSDKHSTQIIEAILEIAKTLSVLHKKGVSHRDIKPQNLFYNDGQFIIGDFGLVDYPDKENELTIQGSSLGPRWTIAPEMRNNPESSNGILADVYSLSKTLWILLTSVEKGFEGQYSPSGSIGLSNYIPEIYLNVLEDLLIKSTENKPELRPNIDEFIVEIESWIELQEDYLKRNNLDWKIVQYKLFPYNMPEYVEWTSVEKICSILNIVGSINSLNHVFFHNGGGLDLNGAKLSKEEGFLELDFGMPYILKPKKLIFCSFNNDLEWNYFFLELENVDQIFKSYNGSEDLIELNNIEYKPYDYIESYYGDDDVSAINYRSVKRLTEGNLVIFRKTSSYNLTPSTYDGRHSEMGAEKFRQYIKELVDMGYKVSYVKEEERVIGKTFTHKI